MFPFECQQYWIGYDFPPLIYTLLLMHSVEQQPPRKDPIEQLKDAAKTHQRATLSLYTIHQLDCKYYGEINKSYQREGFGILQTLAFETYFGFWKNNKADGLGLVVYPSGDVIYAEFSRNVINGVALIDDGKFLRLGVVQGLDFVGIGFEYTFVTSTWKMIKYSRGKPLAQLRQELLTLSQGLPDMITAQHSLFQLIDDYLKCTFFRWEKPKGKRIKMQRQDKYQKLNEILVNRIGETMALGLRDQGGLHGLGVILNREDKQLMQAGYYIANGLEGYCYEKKNGIKSVGHYYKGVKHGASLFWIQNRVDAYQYDDGNQLGQIQLSQQQLQKRQRNYNFQQKNFLSAKNNFDFQSNYHVFQPPQIRYHQQISKTAAQPQKRQKNFVRTTVRPITSSKSRSKVTAQMVRNTVFQQTKKKQPQRTCVDIIRQKVRGLQMVKYEKNARLESEEKRSRLLNSNLQMFKEEQDSIAVQQNPFDKALIGINYINNSPQRKH